MNNQNFYLRLIALLLIIMTVFFYNGTMKDKEQEQNIADLTAKVESLEDQQTEILTALQENYEEQKNAAESKKSSESDEKKSDSKKTSTKEDSEEDTAEDSSDSDNVYKNGTFEGSGTGYGGTITVQVTLQDDTITDVSVTSAPGEDSAYLAQGENVISSIISEQSTDVDTVSGATFSSTGILEAVNDALTKAEN